MPADADVIKVLSVQTEFNKMLMESIKDLEKDAKEFRERIKVLEIRVEIQEQANAK